MVYRINISLSRVRVRARNKRCFWSTASKWRCMCVTECEGRKLWWEGKKKHLGFKLLEPASLLFEKNHCFFFGGGVGGGKYTYQLAVYYWSAPKSMITEYMYIHKTIYTFYVFRSPQSPYVFMFLCI